MLTAVGSFIGIFIRFFYLVLLVFRMLIEQVIFPLNIAVDEEFNSPIPVASALVFSRYVDQLNCTKKGCCFHD